MPDDNTPRPSPNDSAIFLDNAEAALQAASKSQPPPVAGERSNTDVIKSLTAKLDEALNSNDILKAQLQQREAELAAKNQEVQQLRQELAQTKSQRPVPKAKASELKPARERLEAMRSEAAKRSEKFRETSAFQRLTDESVQAMPLLSHTQLVLELLRLLQAEVKEKRIHPDARSKLVKLMESLVFAKRPDLDKKLELAKILDEVVLDLIDWFGGMQSQIALVNNANDAQTGTIKRLLANEQKLEVQTKRQALELAGKNETLKALNDWMDEVLLILNNPQDAQPAPINQDTGGIS